MNEEIRLRPHHALCLRHFVGKGYSPAFVENMTALKERLRRDPGCALRLTFGPDSLCAACPHLVDGRCDSQAKVERLDTAAAAACGWRDGQRTTWRELCGDVDARLMPGGAMAALCADCEWFSLCESLHATEEGKEQLLWR